MKTVWARGVFDLELNQAHGGVLLTLMRDGRPDIRLVGHESEADGSDNEDAGSARRFVQVLVR